MSKRSLLVLSLLLCCAALPVLAQDGKLRMSHLNNLAGKAVESVDLTIDETTLRAMAVARSAEFSDPARARALLSNLKGVSVKGYRFNQPGEFAAEEVEAIRGQLSAPGWRRIVSVRGKRGHDNGELYLRIENETIVGVTVLSAQKDELYIVNIVGRVELDQLSMQEGVRGLSRLDASWDSWTRKRR